jgi:predicted RND superfamily exporter protein
MAYAVRRASRAMKVTSATTAAAFYANIFSPIMPIKAFGIFAGTLIPVNYYLVILMMPSAIILHEENFKYRYFFCMKRYTEDGQELNEHNDPELTHPELTITSKIIIFFDQVWNRFIYKSRFIIIAVSVTWFVLTAIFAGKIGPQTEQPNFLKDDNPVWQPVATMANEFPQDADRFADVYVYWGTAGIDRAGESKWDPDFIGKIELDGTFDLSAEKS